ncbi:MAG TPA: response regulator transcription factor [Saprospiraceae bacterium]|nr:response regulator transcription factor [Saprospiraceae bacterium]
MKKIKLFLADDHQIMLDGLLAFLEKESGIEITGTAKSGEDTLRLLEQQSADVVILDISMPPGIDGIETAKQIRKLYPKTKIILLTMIGDGRYILNALKRGIHGYVIKEKSKETLVAAIHAVLKGNRYFPPELLNRLDGIDDPEDKAEEVQLTKREKEILCLLAENPSFTTREIAERLFIARTTVEKHIQNTKEKLDLHRNTELVRYAMEKKLCI